MTKDTVHSGPVVVLYAVVVPTAVHNRRRRPRVFYDGGAEAIAKAIRGDRGVEKCENKERKRGKKPLKSGEKKREVPVSPASE